MLKIVPLVAVLAVSFLVTPAPSEAKGCIKGALMGGVAGHYAGHGVLGAVGGCVVGRRLANDKAARDQQLQQQNPTPYNGSASPDPSYKRQINDPKYSATTAPDMGGSSGNPGAGYTGGAYRR